MLTPTELYAILAATATGSTAIGAYVAKRSNARTRRNYRQDFYKFYKNHAELRQAALQFYDKIEQSGPEAGTKLHGLEATLYDFGEDLKKEQGA